MTKSEKVRVRFGRRLYDLRMQAELTQKELSKKSGLSCAYISQLENAFGFKNPTLETMHLLSKTIGCTISELTDFEL